MKRSRERPPLPLRRRVQVNKVEEGIKSQLLAAGDRDSATSPTAKKNYAQRLSTAIAQKFANAIRGTYPEVLPRVDGSRQESRARTAKGVKRLDVNYSTPELGLALGISIKTLNFRDGKSKRFTKNITRIDNELRAEAQDYHVRQPFAVMVALLYIPFDSCDDASNKAPSSFGHAVQTLRFRARRHSPSADASLFEKVFVVLYDPSSGDASYFDVEEAPPKVGRPSGTIGFGQVVELVAAVLAMRNESKFEWSDVGLQEEVRDPRAEAEDVDDE